MHDSYIYQVKDLSFEYLLGQQKVKALNHVNIEIPKSKLITFSGPSGSGKSTFLNILGLIEPLQKGSIFFEGVDVSSLSCNDKNQLRKYKIGFIFQQFHLIPVLTVEENVSYFLKKQGLKKKEVEERVRHSLEAVGILKLCHKFPNEISGGERQRVAIARALAKKPDVIIGDEPTANLDQKTGRGIMECFLKLIQDDEVSILLTTHDPMVKSFSEKNFHLQDGSLA